MKAFPLPFATMAVLGMLVCVPAHAGDLSLLNKTQYELSYIYIDTSGADGKGRTGAAASALPGCSFVFGAKEGSTITGITLDTGLAAYKFDNLNIKEGAFKILEDEDRIILTSADMDDDAAIAAAKGAGGAAAEPQFIDVDAGPIWDNDHAGETCPDVAKAWMEENPGMTAEWTGHWNTPEGSETSVCNLRVQSEGGSSDTASNGVLIATTTKILAGSPQAPFEKVIAVRNVEEAKALGAAESHRSQMVLTTELNGVPMVAYFHASSFDGEVSAIQFYAPIVQETEISATLKALSEMGYRPWYAMVSVGEDQEVDDTVRFWDSEEYDTKEKAESAIETAMNEEIYPSTSPVAMNTFFLSADGWEKAAAGAEEVVAPCMDIHVSPAVNFVLNFRPDGSGVIAQTRMAN